MEKEKEGFPITSLREINTLLKAQHPNIVTVREIVVGSNMDKIFIVMDYVEHDLKSLIETIKQKKQVFIPGKILLTFLLSLCKNFIYFFYIFLYMFNFIFYILYIFNFICFLLLDTDEKNFYYFR